MQEPDFLRLADSTLDALMQQLEASAQADALDIDLIQGILTITLEDSGRQFVVSKHSPSRQLWLSSPVSGGVHFSYDAEVARWLAGGRELTRMLSEEIHTLLT